MANVTVSLPPDLKERMDAFKEINWSAVARAAIEDKLTLLSALDTLLSDSKLTQEDIAREALAIKKSVWKKHKKLK